LDEACDPHGVFVMLTLLFAIAELWGKLGDGVRKAA
jgi:hypothetical protein